MAPTAPTCLEVTGGLQLNGKPYLVLLWSQNEAGGNGTFARLEFCTGAACGGFTEFAAAPVESLSAGYDYESCSTLYALRGQYTYGILQTAAYSTVYRFRIRNERNGAFSSYSNTGEFTTAADPGVPVGSVVTPNPPTALSLSGSGNTINLSWTDNATNENGFTIEKKFLNGSYWSPWQAFATVAASTTTYADTGLAYQTTYRYRVRAYNDYGFSDYSNDEQRTTGSLSIAGLSAPTFTSATLENYSTDPRIVLIWTDNATAETAYFIERSASNAVSSGYVVIQQVGANVITWTDEDVFYGVTYNYRIRAYKSSTGEYSPYTSTVRIVGIPPAAVFGGTLGAGTTGWGIAHDNPFFAITTPSIGGVIRDNILSNNGNGGLAPSVYTLEGITIDNPGYENTYIRRGVTLIP